MPLREEEDRPVVICFDVSEFSDEDIAEVLGLFSDLYHAVSGDVLVIEAIDSCTTPVNEGPP